MPEVRSRPRSRCCCVFLSVLRKYWFLIVGMTLLVTGLVIVYEAQKPDFYQASVRIQVNNEINPAAGAMALAVRSS